MTIFDDNRKETLRDMSRLATEIDRVSKVAEAGSSMLPKKTVEQRSSFKFGNN